MAENEGELAGLTEGKGGDIMIDCPYCSFKRPVAACLATCEYHIVNWCPKIKTVPVEVLDEMAPKALQGKPHLEDAWAERRSFFTEPVRETRSSHEDDFDPETHGGGGVKTAQEIESEAVQSFELDAPNPSSGDEEEEFQMGPHSEDEDQQEDQQDEDQDGQNDQDQQGDGEPEATDPDGDDESGDGETGEENQVSDAAPTEEQTPCPVEGCEYVAKSERAMKIHTTRAHGDGASSEPRASKKAPSKKKTGKGKSVDTGKLIIVAGETCAIVDASKDFSETIAAISENGKAKIYRLGPEVVVRTVIHEV